MDDTLYVTSDWQRFVPAGDPEAAFGVAAADVDRLGLQEKLAEFQAPKKVPDEPEDESEAKEAPKPSDKSAKRPKTK